MVIEGGTVYYIRADHIGRPVFATNSVGVKVWSAVYTPFGGVHTATGALPANRLPGQWFQTENGLHKNWMRDYDPTTGRYVQADPLGLVDGASVYGYVRQSPMMLTDPRGECAGPMAIACAAAAGAAMNMAIGYLLEMTIGDGCYTWYDVGRDGALGAMFGGLGRAWGMTDDAIRHGAAYGASAGLIPKIAPHGHHPIPMFIGGSPGQALTPLAPSIHTGAGGFHSQLNQALRNAFGRGGGGPGGSRRAWDDFFSQNPGTYRQAMDTLLDVSRNFDAANGTSVTSAVWNSIISGGFKAYP